MKIDFKTVITLLVLVFSLGMSWQYNKSSMDDLKKQLKEISTSVDSIKSEISADAVIQMSCDCYKDSKLQYDRNRLGIK